MGVVGKLCCPLGKLTAKGDVPTGASGRNSSRSSSFGESSASGVSREVEGVGDGCRLSSGPDTERMPLAEVGLESRPASSAAVLVDKLDESEEFEARESEARCWSSTVDVSSSLTSDLTLCGVR